MDKMKLIEMLLNGGHVHIAKNAEYTLGDDEKELAYALIRITERHGKFNEDYKGVWAGYDKPEDNDVAKIGVKCANCVLYDGGSECKILLNQVEPEGKCRFAIIPDGVVQSYTGKRK